MILENIKIMYKAWFDAEMRDKWISEREPYERWLERKLFETQSKSKESDSLPCVSGCSFALWLQENYSTNEKQGSDKPLPKGYWRKDFTDEIHKVEDLWVVFNNR